MRSKYRWIEKELCLMSSFVISLLVRALWHGLDDTTIIMGSFGVALQLNLHYSISGAAKVRFTCKSGFLLLKAYFKKHKSKKGRLAQNVVHVGKVHFIGIFCLYACSMS